MSSIKLQPRALRHKDAAAYLAVNVNYFNKNIRPYLTEIKYGPQMVAFDRCELDDWFDNYMSSNGRPSQLKGDIDKWDERKSPVSLTGRAPGMSTRLSEGQGFAKALERVKSKKLKNI